VWFININNTLSLLLNEITTFFKTWITFLGLMKQMVRTLCVSKTEAKKKKEKKGRKEGKKEGRKKNQTSKQKMRLSHNLIVTLIKQINKLVHCLTIS
jgi:predicted transposase YdaD